MSEDVKPREWPGNQVDIQKYLKLHDELCDILEERGSTESEIVQASVGIWGALKVMHDKLEPTLQLMKEMGEFLKKSEMILSYQNLTTLPIHVREPDGSISMQRPKSQIGLLYDENKEVLEKYRKFKDGLK